MKNHHVQGIDFTYRLIEFLGQGILGLLSVISKIKFWTTINDSISLIIGTIILFTSVLWIMNYKNLFKKMLEPVRMVELLPNIIYQIIYLIMILQIQMILEIEED